MTINRCTWRRPSDNAVCPTLPKNLEGKEKSEAFEKCMSRAFERCALLEDAMEEYISLCALGSKEFAQQMLAVKLELGIKET